MSTSTSQIFEWNSFIEIVQTINKTSLYLHSAEGFLQDAVSRDRETVSVRVSLFRQTALVALLVGSPVWVAHLSFELTSLFPQTKLFKPLPNLEFVLQLQLELWFCWLENTGWLAQRKGLHETVNCFLKQERYTSRLLAWFFSRGVVGEVIWVKLTVCSWLSNPVVVQSFSSSLLLALLLWGQALKAGFFIHF